MLLCEEEVSINFTADEDLVNIYTSIPSWIRKLDSLCAEHPESYEEVVERRGLVDGEIVSKTYVLKDRKLLYLRPARLPKRELSEEEKEVLRERMKKMQEAKKAKES